MGDSNAGQFTEALISAAEELDRPLVVATRGGCPFADVRVRTIDTEGLAAKGCKAWYEDAKEWLGDQDAGTAVVASAGEAITDESLEVQGSGEGWSDDTYVKERIWRDGSLAGAESIDAAGHQIVVVAPVPHLPGEGRPWWHPAECSNVPLFQGKPKECDRSVAVEEYRSAQSADRAAARDSAAAVDGVFLDVQGELCDDGTCSAFREGHWWYRDGLHISTYASEQLAESFVNALKEADAAGSE